MSLSLNLYQSMALAVAIFYFGAFLKSKISVFRTYCIPSPVIGGIIYAIVNLILYQTGVLQLSVATTLQSVFMNVFFTSVGFTAGFGMLKKGGKSLIVFLVAVCILIGIQDVAGAALCKVFGLQPLLGLAMMGMQLWQLADLAGPMVAILLIQTVLTGLFVYFVTFNMMGRDYDAAVLSAGHCGFGMGATPNAMANMDALTKVFGPSEKAYLIIPVCGGFFTDIVNSLILTFFMNVL